MPPTDSATEGEVVSAIDDDGRVARLVVADVTRDGAWVTAPAAETAPLAEWA